MQKEGSPVVCWKCIVKFKKYKKCALDFIDYFKDDEVMLKRSEVTKEHLFLISIGKAKITDK